MTVKTQSLRLNWKFDGSGEWEAVSQIMDPDMIDEPVESWCKEWCLMWRIQVLEDGTFWAATSDSTLLNEVGVALNGSWDKLSLLQAKIESLEETFRAQDTIGFRDPQPVMLLASDKYKA